MMTDQKYLFTRREFLLSSAIAGVGLSIPQFLTASAEAAGMPGSKGLKDDRILVVIQLGGGNDGCNTIIPYGNDDYYRARPNLAVDKKQIIQLDDQLGLHESLGGFMDLLQQGQAAVINGVGYPNPNRSHFRSMEIMQTASDSERFETTGWIGRYFDNCCNGAAKPTTGVSITQELPQAFNSKSGAGVSFMEPNRFRWIEGNNGDTENAFKKINKTNAHHDDDHTIDFLRHTTANAVIASDSVIRAGSTKRRVPEYPRNRLANSLKTIATLIAGGLPTRIYYASMTGFDTHANQPGQHANLLRQFSDSIAAFQKDLAAIGVADRVMTLAFSEFGRRVEENASRGTDHGTAGPMFLVGKNIQSGVHGKYPSLSDLDEGDLKHSVDFRSVYGEILTKWFEADQEKVLGRAFPSIGAI